MKILKAEIKDVKSILEIESNSGYRWNPGKKDNLRLIESLMKDKNSSQYILKRKDIALGWFCVSLDYKNRLNIDFLAIKKKFQSKGLSKVLLKKIINIGKKNRSKKIVLEVWGKNFVAIGLYNSFGFYVTDIKKEFYKNKDNKLVMEMEI